jgi:hypothetical protein
MRILPFLVVTASLLAGCQESVFQSLKKTDELFVYEGLPHPGRENPSFEKEKKRKDVRQIDGHWFYDAKGRVNGESHEGLMNLLFDESGFGVPGPNTPPKDCGPFHPDYAIAWKSDGEENYLMICYTCREAKLIGDGHSKTYELVGIGSWKKLLANFQSNRPQK